jgi:hypothetical protein
MFNRFWPKPPEADGDIQTDDDAARPEEYRRNRIASVDDEEDKEEEDEDDVMTQVGTEILGNNGREAELVWKELCYQTAETLEDAEEAARCWRYNLL